MHWTEPISVWLRTWSRARFPGGSCCTSMPEPKTRSWSCGPPSAESTCCHAFSIDPSWCAPPRPPGRGRAVTRRELRAQAPRRPAPPASLSGSTDRGGRHRRVRQVDAAPAARALAHRAGLPRALHGVELVAVGPPLDEAGQEEGPPHTDDLLSAPRRR